MKLISDAIKKLMMEEPYYGLFASGLKKEYTDKIDTAGVCLDGIDYKDGIPDFSKCAETAVQIDNMSDRRYGQGGNFEQCDSKCAEKWNHAAKDGKTDWTARDVEEWRKANKYSWHERNDMRTCDLVPTKVNDYFSLLGGVSE